MDFIQILILAIVQWITEFLPVSSSAHLILTPLIFDFVDQGFGLDVAVHLGSLIAVITYFHRDIRTIVVGWLVSLLPGKAQSAESRLGWAVIVGVIPVVVTGILIKELVENDFRSATLIATTTILFGLLLGWADTTASRQRQIDEITPLDGLLIGLAQVLALIPGTSRSGITITAGLMIGLTRSAASRFSYFLAIPTILGASLLVCLELAGSAETPDWMSLALGVVLSATAAYVCIHLFLTYIERMGMWPFVIYRLALGAGIFVLLS